MLFTSVYKLFHTGHQVFIISLVYIKRDWVKLMPNFRKWCQERHQSTWNRLQIFRRTCRLELKLQVGLMSKLNMGLLLFEIVHLHKFYLVRKCIVKYYIPCIGIYRELCLESVKNKYDCETQAALQHWEVSFTDVICYYLNNGACLKCLFESS